MRIRSLAQVIGISGSVIDEQVEGITRPDDWGRRRGTIRHDVSLPAIVFDRKGNAIACTVEDISSTGMALKIDLKTPEPGREALEQGTSARLEFSVRLESGAQQKVAAPVQIMWRTPVGLGVRFKQQDENLHAALKVIAQAAVTARAAEPQGGRHDRPANHRKIMLACRKTSEKLLPNIIWALRTETGRRLRHEADGASPSQAREARAEADLLDDKAIPIGRTIERQFLQSFAVVSDLDQTQEMTVAPMFLKKTEGTTNSAYDVVGEDEVQQDATIIAIGHAAAEKFKLPLFQLNVRLAGVLGHPLNPAENPLQPTTACRILWQATVDFCDSPRVRRCLHDAIRSRVVPLLGELYEALDKTLDEEGVPRAFERIDR